MNREIKFRAWDKVSEKMLSPQDLIDREIWISPDGEVFDVHETHDYYSGIKFVKNPDLILMQSTGLHDKNGKEIWAGDIVDQGFYPNFIVKFGPYDNGEYYDDRCSGVGFYLEGTGSHEWITNMSQDDSYILVGNIFEHEHLLGKEE
jgi:uncharacterized phage protein (TIGR01671 family)